VRALLTVVLVGTFGVSAFAAEYGLETWTSGSGTAARTYVFKTQGNTFTGTACGPCDDPSTVVRIAQGTKTGPGHIAFSLIGGKSGPATSTITLTRVDGDGTAVATIASAAAPKTTRLDGRWVAQGRTAQQNVTLKLRDGNTVWGVICGPCDKPAGVFLIDDGMLDGDAISFFIHHVDNRRNFMKGTITGNVMKFKWVREGRENEPGGEMTLIGPIR